jgi:protein involved in polysaccharide export with SLBB domain
MTHRSMIAMLNRVSAAAALMVGVFLAGSAAQAAVHPGDELQVTVYDHPELSGPLAVDSSSRISLPLIGFVDVHGLDAPQIAQRIRADLLHYVRKPTVDVQLKAQIAVLYVSGGPGGTLPYQPGETLVSALGTLTPRMRGAATAAAADGTVQQGVTFDSLQSTRVDLRHVTVTRDGHDIGTYDALALFARGEGGPVLKAADTIALVNKPVTVNVTGEVASPGTAYLAAKEPLSDAIAQSGGLLPTSSVSRLVLRRAGTSRTISPADSEWTQPAQNGDSIAVPVAPRVSVGGVVEHPGAVTLKSDATLLGALYEAGGPAKYGDMGRVQVLHDGVKTTYDMNKVLNGSASQNPSLSEGDVVVVPQGRHVDGQSLFQNLVNSAFLLRF